MPPYSRMQAGGTASVSHTPFSDRKNLQPSRNIRTASITKTTGWPRRWPTFVAVWNVRRQVDVVPLALGQSLPADRIQEPRDRTVVQQFGWFRRHQSQVNRK